MTRILLLCLAMSLASSMTSFGPHPIGVNFCCGEDETLVVRRINPSKRVTECVGRGEVSSLEGKKVWVGGEKDGELKSLKLLEVNKPDCQRGLVLTTVRAKKTFAEQEEDAAIPLFPVSQNEIILQGGQLPNEGNVFVRGKPVCDDSWGQEEANVVCRSLGYSGGRATKESQYGNIPGGDFGMDDVQCQGSEDKLTDCRYTSTDDCGPGEAAGVVCDRPEQAAVLTSSGELLFQLNSNSTNIDFDREEGEEGWRLREEPLARLGQGEFCLVQDYTLDNSVGSDDLLALSCDACSEQVICSYAKELFDSISSSRWDRTTFTTLLGHTTDANGDAIIDFDEWFSKLKSWFTVAFDVLDENQDGSILDEAQEGNILNSIPYHSFVKVLNQVFDFFDSNKDGAISLEDNFFLDLVPPRRDRNGDGKMTLSEAIGANLISLPAPVYNFYKRLDRDKDERLTRAEALDFVSKVFTLINTPEAGKDSDCKIDVNEVIQFLDALKLPWDYQHAVRQLLTQELSLASELVKNLAERADKDQNKEVSIEEILTFDDFEFIESALPVVLELGIPYNSVDYLASPASCGRRIGRRGCNREADEAHVEMWLTVLQKLMENEIFSSAGEGEGVHNCGDF